MLEILGTAISAILGGGATGLLGVVFQRFADYKNRQLDLQLADKKNAQELAMRKADAEIMAQEWAARTKVAEVEAGAKVEVADAEAFAESFKMEPSQFSAGVKPTEGQGWILVLLDAFRGVIRPGLTVYLCAITTMVYFDSQALLTKAAFTEGQAFDMVKMIVGTILYLTTTCVLWWFGTRQRGPIAKI